MARHTVTGGPTRPSLRNQLVAEAARRDALAQIEQAEKIAKRAHDRAMSLDQKRWGGSRGASGPGSSRLTRKMRLSAHTATSEVLKSWYPWVMDPGLGVDGPPIGIDLFNRGQFMFDPYELYAAGVISSPNFVLIGEIGSAKSSLIKTLLLRLWPFGIRFGVSDVKSEYRLLCALLGITPARIGPGLLVRLNPLGGIARIPGQTEQEWRQLQRTRRVLLLIALLEVQLDRPCTQIEKSVLGYAIDAATGENTATGGTSAGRLRTPNLPLVLHSLCDMQAWAHRVGSLSISPDKAMAATEDIRLSLDDLVNGSLRGMFDGDDDTTTQLDFAAPGVVIDLEAVRGNQTLQVMAMTCAQSALEAEFTRPDAGRRILVDDEAWKNMGHLALLKRSRERYKLCRQYGIPNGMAFHRFSDLDAIGDAGSEAARIARSLLDDTGVRIAYRQVAGSLPMTQDLMGLTDVQTDLLRFLKPGVALWKLGNRPFVVKHELTDIELPMVQTDSRMARTPGIDDISAEDWEDLISDAVLLDA